MPRSVYMKYNLFIYLQIRLPYCKNDYLQSFYCRNFDWIFCIRACIITGEVLPSYSWRRIIDTILDASCLSYRQSTLYQSAPTLELVVSTISHALLKQVRLAFNQTACSSRACFRVTMVPPVFTFIFCYAC